MHNCVTVNQSNTIQRNVLGGITRLELTIPCFRNCKFVRVSYLFGRYFYDIICIVKCLKLCFPLMSRTIVYFHVYITLDFPII